MKQPVNVYGTTEVWDYGQVWEESEGFGYQDENGNITWYNGYEQPKDDEFHLSYIRPYGDNRDLSEILKANGYLNENNT